jgi:CelD/BcsL family acetyltransferase involved in cellulose biosynthesis
MNDSRDKEIEARLLSPFALSDADVACWRGFMAADASLQTPFLSYAYSAAAAKVFRDVQVCQLSSDGRTQAFFSFQYPSLAHRLFGIGERIGGELSDYFGIVAAPGFSISAERLLKHLRLHALYFTHLDESQLRFGVSGEAPEPGLRISLPKTGSSLWETRRRHDKKFTSDTERRERKLIEAHGPLRFLFRDPDPLARLDETIQRKRAQYARTGVPDVFGAVSKRRFMKVLATSQDQDCHATLSTLHAGNIWVASHFGLMYGHTLHYWFPVYNPDLRAFAPGRLLLKNIIANAQTAGIRLIDHGAGDTPAKREFANNSHSYLRGIWNRPDPIAISYRTALSIGWRMNTYRRKHRELLQ